MIYNTFNRFQPLFAKHDPDGLTARMNSFLDGEKPADPAPVASTQPDPPADPAPIPSAKPVEIKAEPKTDPKPEDPKPDDVDDEDDEFPEIGKPVTPDKPDGLDDASFDAETDKAVEGMEEKAGEKFKALRAELKSLKKKEFKPDPEAIPEYKALKAEVEELRKAKEELDGTKARLESVMKASDELAVKESDEFINKVKNPLTEMQGALTSLADASGLSATDLMQVIAEEDPGKQDKALTSLESKVSRRTLSRLERLCDDYRVIEQEEQRLLADIPKTLAESRKQQQEQAEQVRKLVTGQFQDAARNSFKEYGHTVPGFTDTAGALSETAKAMQAAAVSVDPHSLSPDDLGFMIFASKALPSARKEIKRLMKEVSILKGGSPDVIPGKAPAAPKASADDGSPKGQTLAERMKGQNFSFNAGLVG